MKTLSSYVNDRFVEGQGTQHPLFNPATEQALAQTSTQGIDMKAALWHAREVGSATLRELSFAERGKLLAAMAGVIHQHRDALIAVAVENGGNTRGDAKFDIDGAMATLQHYAELGQRLGAAKYVSEGEAFTIGRNPRWVGAHVRTPLFGVALHINAFNFPAWNYMEKAAVALLSGVAVVTKPATSTALLAHRLTELIVEAKILPSGALTFLCGGAGDVLDHLTGQDVIAFTGSAQTATVIRGHQNVLAQGVRVNIEADSLNSAVLGTDVETGGETYDAFIRDLVKEMTQKAGQKCTAIRRVFVPRALLGDVVRDVGERLSEIKVGDPSADGVGMGPVATAQQLRDVKEGIETLSREAKVVHGGGSVTGSDKGFFVAPTLLVCERPGEAQAVHTHEVFGPVSTVMPYETVNEAAALVRRGGGSLVASVYSDDETFCEAMLLGTASHSGRLFFSNEKVAAHTFNPGAVLASLVHGGPGRAGSGEELGGARALALYTQRTALQGNKPTIERLLAKGASLAVNTRSGE